ncbi:NUMOD3 domain-containing DNA-binding protein [Dysgonomonas macrotermitis]|uniref:NUMOD3 motif-containing protein n=1 Tax=Dysgonomonas macrotermitis TaxID=1346286 RepID=A0A1M5DC26_9BACT|nr:NUMOD3 domain-containing DNA-binding protein [Dysgonomonas macrotermitis]SHF64496.1 NUMOD3 motif-containing protein [Dysgonomonas macrotermitis]
MNKRIYREADEMTKYKMSLSKSNSLNPNYGKPRDEETKQKISDSMKKYWSEVPFKNEFDKK